MKKETLPFVGAATALITPMNGDTSVDYGAFGRLIDIQIDAGIDALLVLGTTGEPSTLSDSEKRECILFAAEKINGRVPLIVGTGTNDTKNTLTLSRFAADSGADAVLLVTPYYNKTTNEGLVRHFSTVADSCGCPVILYNIPARTGMDIPLSVYKKLAEHDNIVGVKEASGNIGNICALLAEVGDTLAVYSGNDTETVPIMAAGGRGVFSVLSNIAPKDVVSLVSFMESGNFKAAADLSKRLSSLTRALFCEVNPIPVKAAAEMAGICSSALRPPLCTISKEHRILLEKELKNTGII